MRGKVYSKGVGQIYSGITPACAGKRPACPAESALVEDHPRVCGEKLRLSLFFASSLGSPPRVRGKASLKISFFMVARITPACAGKSLQQRGRSNIFWDHPRVCGEKTGLSSRISPCGGSPPRVRGKVATLTFFRLFSGITPACAGKSKFKNIFFHGCKDHPRVCGEKLGAGSICFL